MAFTWANVVNNKYTTLDGAITDAVPGDGGSLTVAATAGFPASGYLAIDSGLATYEIVRYEAVADGTHFTLAASGARGADGTTAYAHSTLAMVELVVAAAHVNELRNILNLTVAGRTAGQVLIATAADAFAFSDFMLAGTALQTYTFPAATADIPGGSGTASYVARWSGANALGNSLIRDNATTLSVGVAPVANQLLTIQGATATNELLTLRTSDSDATMLVFAIRTLAGTLKAGASVYGHFGFGGSVPVLDYILSSGETFTGVGFTQPRGASFDVYAKPGANTYIRYIGGRFVANLIASEANTLQSTVGGLVGGIFAASKAGTGQVNSAWASEFFISNTNATGAIVSGVAIKINSASNSGGGITTVDGLFISDQTVGGTNYAIRTGKGLIVLGDQVKVNNWQDIQAFTVTGHTAQAQATALGAFTRNDAAAGISDILALTGLGSGADGDGIAVDFFQKSATTPATQIGRIRNYYVSATHLSRTTAMVFSCWDTAERDALAIGANGSAATIGFLGALMVARQAHIADASGGATVDAEARAAINAALAVLENFGLVATS